VIVKQADSRVDRPHSASRAAVRRCARIGTTAERAARPPIRSCTAGHTLSDPPTMMKGAKKSARRLISQDVTMRSSHTA
jgi:hypothetical protein